MTDYTHANIAWDICPHLHAMNDMGGTTGEHRSTTYNAECYLLESGGSCPRNGKCIIAKDPRTFRAITRSFGAK